jgi:penicillin-binding protein 1B
MRKNLNNQLSKLLNRKTILLILKSCCLGTIVLLIALLAYVYMVVQDLEIYLEDAKVSRINDYKSKIEADSIVGESEFRFYNNFLDKEYSAKEIIEKTNQIKGLKLVATEDIILGGLIKNDCKSIYCYQHKVSFEQIPTYIWKGLIGIEDTRFLKHMGIDPVSILRALVADIKAMKIVQGGSTITQQLAKNLFLTSEKTIKRKFNEWIYAIYIERNFSKEDILKTYFNEMEWGSLNRIRIKGVYMASLFYFNKKPALLTAYEATILISMLKGPYYYHPINHTKRLKNRVNVDFNQLVKNSLFLSSDSQWEDSKWEGWALKLQKNINNNYYKSLWLSTNHKKNVLNQYQAYVFDLSTFQLLKKLKLRYKTKNLSFKTLITDIDCDDCKPFYYYSSYERKLVEALEHEKHQVGSILKPIIYSFFIEEGYDWDDEVSTKPITLKLLSGNWTPKDSTKAKTKIILLEDALKKSRNIPTIKISKNIGFEIIEKKLAEYIPEIKRPLKEYPSQLLGAVELSLSEIAIIYKKFITKVCHSEGRSSISVLSNPNETTLKRVVKKPLNEMKFFGKTGTSNSGLDSWFIGFDGKLLSISWFGVDGDRSNKYLRIGGATSSFKIFQSYLIKSGKRLNLLNCN